MRKCRHGPDTDDEDEDDDDDDKVAIIIPFTVVVVVAVVVVVVFISVTCGMKYIIINIYKQSVHKLARLPPSPTGLTSHNESTLHKIILFGRW